MRKLLVWCLALIVIGIILLPTNSKADEVNIKFASFVTHHFKIKGFDWNEGWNNRAKGIEYIYDTDNKNHGIGVTYLNFYNSFYNKTIAKGLVYRYRKPITDNVAIHTKAYILKQKGYYGTWRNPMPYSTYGDDNEFWSPLVSVGLNYKGFTVDGLGTQNSLHAVTFGYSWRF